MTDTVDQPAVLHDPSHEVPPDYDVFCEGCGYSLVGLAADRCPECGAAYDPAALPFARVPWLYRQRTGAVRAYVATVWMILLSPRRFARELCRPVRVSVADARRFRWVTVWIAAASVLLAIVGIAAADDPPGQRTPARVALMLAAFAVYGLAAAFFFLIATDVPLSIWKGSPSLPRNELAPIHHYASAPLALMPFATFAGFQTALGARLAGVSDVDGHGILAFGIGLAAVLLTLWVSSIVLMASATRGGWRVLAFAVYLPLQWLVALLATVLGSGAALYALELLSRTLRR